MVKNTSKSTKKTTRTSAARPPRHSKTAAKPVTIDLAANKLEAKAETAATKSKPSQTADVKKQSAASEFGRRKSQPAKAETSSDKQAATPKKTDGAAAQSDKKAAPSTPPSAKPSTTRSSTASAPVPVQKGGFAGKMFAGILGGIIALGGGAALQYFGYLPIPAQNIANSQQVDVVTTETLENRLAALQQKLSASQESTGSAPIDESAINAAIDSRLAALAESGAVPTTDMTRLLEDNAGKISKLQERMDQAQEGLASLQATIAATPTTGEATGQTDGATFDTSGLTTSISDLQNKFALLESGLAALATTTKSLPENIAETKDIEALNSKLDALQSEVASQEEAFTALQSNVTENLDTFRSGLENGADKKAARALAAAALKSTIDQGLPFAGQLATLKAVTGADSDFSSLEPYAESGIPTIETLSNRFDALGEAIIAATTTNEEGNALSRLLAGAKSLVKVKKLGPVEGNTPAAIVSRVSAALNAGNLQTALSQWATLPPAGQAISSQWQKDLQARADAQSLVANTVQSFMLSGSSGN